MDPHTPRKRIAHASILGPVARLKPSSSARPVHSPSSHHPPHGAPTRRGCRPHWHGRSDKPDFDDRYADHARYLERFIVRGLDDITLVVHDWGSALGLHHAERVNGLVLMEAMLRPLSWSVFDPGFRLAFQMMRAPIVSYLMV